MLSFLNAALCSKGSLGWGAGRVPSKGLFLKNARQDV